MPNNSPDHEMATGSYAASTLPDDQQASLNDYVNQVKHQRITPRQWLKDRPRQAGSEEFRKQLWQHYCLTYPPPVVPGFVLQDVLGEGGMAQVFLAWVTHLDRPAALKEMTGTCRRDADFQDRFRLEAKTLAKLDHPNIVKVYQFVRHDGRDFIAMEYAIQGSLAERLTPDAPEPLAATVRLVAKLARANEQR